MRMAMAMDRDNALRRHRRATLAAAALYATALGVAGLPGMAMGQDAPVSVEEIVRPAPPQRPDAAQRPLSGAIAARSLLFRSVERQDIETALEADIPPEEVEEIIRSTLRPDQASPTEGLPEVYVGGIIYAGPGNWSAWVNDEAVRPGDRDPLIRVDRVNQHGIGVTVGADLDNANRVQLSLRPHQTFRPGLEDITSGDARARPEAADDDPNAP